MKTELLIQMDGVRGVKVNEQVCKVLKYGPLKPQFEEVLSSANALLRLTGMNS